MLARLIPALALLLSPFLASRAAAAGEEKPDPVLGKWIWHGGVPVTVEADGKAVSTKGNKAIWKFLNNKEVERKYEFVWDDGIFVDTVKLSRDARKLEGRNQKGQRVWADRSPVP